MRNLYEIYPVIMHFVKAKAFFRNLLKVPMPIKMTCFLYPKVYYNQKTG